MILRGNDDLSHIYILYRFDGAILIDPSHDLAFIEAALKGYTLKAILLTHGHIDHTALIDHFNVPVYMHKDDYLLMYDADQSGAKSLKMALPKFKGSDIQFIKDLDKIPFMDETLTVYHTPGHTKGSVCYLYRNELYTGDTLFKGGVGRTDLVGGSTAQLNKSLKRLFTECSQTVKIFPGHDGTTTLKDEKKNNEYIQKILSK
ncbi:MBL fold metallo-hydrolase [Acholeplasma vituli]|uniref:MBL fold metallo-hydrolase n=2 Tax=Paracholeplasma vituli TaxID=69473 RepID=A0ABT2PUM3_9MOLU|nr:MBL fold metallo-hydrolase [Paracholeplasma vituli]